jgi:2-amino-4-hydroxy-6-hydroxymethyldihydropteridine diphosphokinase
LSAGAAGEAVIGLGSNLGDKVAHIDRAIALLTRDGSVRELARSRYYRTAPWGYTEQDWFVNACLRVATALSPRELLARCLAVEEAMGRKREVRWGPRIIDLDILLYGDRAIDEPGLVVPHPQIGARAFVLVPLLDVAPDARITNRPARDLLAGLDASEVVPLD